MNPLIANLPLAQVPDVIQKLDDEVTRLRSLQQEMVAVLDGARICLKNRDQNAYEEKVLESIVCILSRVEEPLVKDCEEAATEIER